MNIITSPSDFLTSSRTFLSLSSNSPLYLEPATIPERSNVTRAPISSANIFLFLSPSGTSPLSILCASPSTTAVLPTPGSPISTGLFFVFLDRILITFRISASRPITGSSFCCLALSTRSYPNFSIASYELSGSSLSTLWLPLISASSLRNAFLLTPQPLRSSLISESALSTMPRNKCSTDTYVSPICFASFSAWMRAFEKLFPAYILPPLTFGNLASLSSTAFTAPVTFTPIFSNILAIKLSSISSKPAKRCICVSS